MSTELYRVHRPKLFKHVVGQDDAVRALSTMVKTERVPHALLFTGPSGVGKTTLARILKEKLECGDGDFREINAADFRGIDTVRDIKSVMNLQPMTGKVRICLIDECHQLTKDAQNALLKALEDTPKHFYFFLATTDPVKLLKTIITRCTEIRLREMDSDALTELVKEIATREKLKLSEEVVDKLVECSLGSARMALVLLNKLMGIEDDAERIRSIEENSAQKETIELCRALLKRAPWIEIRDLLKKIDGEPETVRRQVLGWMAAVLMNSGMPRAYDVMNTFQYNFFDTGRPGLIRACFEISPNGKR